VLQELVLGSMLEEKGSVGLVFGALLASSALAALFLGVLLVRNRMGSADV